MVKVITLLLALALPSGAWGQEPKLRLLAQDDSTFSSGETSVSSQIEAQREPSIDRGGGPAVDATGSPADDPTANVIALQRAATQRQDDLREASERFTLEQIKIRFEAAEALNALRYENSALLRAAESRRLDDLLAQRADYDRRLLEAEAKRIDAIRAVDVNAVQNATERAVEQASVLAQQLDRSAETSRTLVSTTEQSLAASQRQSFSEFSNRITALEQLQSFGQGRQTVSDPAVVALTEQVAKLTAAQNSSAGESAGSSNTIGLIFGGIGAVLGLIGIIAAVVAAFAHRRPSPSNGNGQYYGQKVTA